MSRSPLTLAAAASILLALAACDRPAEPAPTPKPAPAPAAAAPEEPLPPLSFHQVTPNAEVELKLPPEAARVEALYAKLYAEDVADLRAFAEGAQGDIAELRAAGETVRPYARSLEYAVTAQTSRLLSLSRLEYENTGGAHPNTVLGALVWDKRAGRAVAASELLRPGADTARADKALCDAIKAAKQARMGETTFTGSLKDCPKLADATVALAASTTPGKAGGLVVMFPTYALGPRVEGEYRIVLPLAAVKDVLAPDYAGEFAGAPAPGAAGDPV
jgi:hypothetical protein